jgi:XTP/dITP diphosphohydrolase
MTLDITLASGNAHKAEEFGELFNSSILSIKSAPEKLEVVEDGSTFRENAFKKAQAYFEKFGEPVMADDSGLLVEALPGKLGLHTARYGGDDLTAKERNELLLQEMTSVDEEKRAAYFICVLCFYLGESEVFFFEGRVHGSIANEMSGAKGFGYDPVFIPSGAPDRLTLAEVPEWKNENSHRAVACQHAQKFFKERVGQN